METPQDVADYVQNVLNIPERYAQAFVDNYIDGEEFINLTQDDISKFITPTGLVKKIFRHIEGLRREKTEANVTSIIPLSSIETPVATPSSTSSCIIATSSPSTSTSNCSTSSSASSQPIEIPSVWTASTQRCLNEKRVTPDVRREIVHTLSVMMMANSSKMPTLLDCERVANSIIIKYPFLADPFGNSQSGSWKMKLIQCLRNREKYRKKVYGGNDGGVNTVSPISKKGGKVLVPRKIQLTNEKTSSDEELRDAMLKELGGVNVRVDVLKPLMTATFNSRQLNIGETAIAEVLQLYPALRIPAILEHEFCLIIKNSEIKVKFESLWSKWQEAILSYCSLLKKRSITELLEKGSTFEKCFPMIYSECDVATSLEEVATLYKGNTPRIVKMDQSFFIVAEQDILCDVDNLNDAVFLWFTTHYVFNMEYNKVLTNVGLFFQDNVFEHSHHGTRRTRSPTYNSVIGDIKQYLK